MSHVNVVVTLVLFEECSLKFVNNANYAYLNCCGAFNSLKYSM